MKMSVSSYIDERERFILIRKESEKYTHIQRYIYIREKKEERTITIEKEKEKRDISPGYR